LFDAYFLYNDPEAQLSQINNVTFPTWRYWCLDPQEKNCCRMWLAKVYCSCNKRKM